MRVLQVSVSSAVFHGVTMCSSFNVNCSLPPKQLSAAVAPLVSVMTVAREVAVNVFARAVTEHPATVETSANARKDAASACTTCSKFTLLL